MSGNNGEAVLAIPKQDMASYDKGERAAVGPLTPAGGRQLSPFLGGGHGTSWESSGSSGSGESSLFTDKRNAL